MTFIRVLENYFENSGNFMADNVAKILGLLQNPSQLTFSMDIFELFFSKYRSFRLFLIIFGFTLCSCCGADIFNINLFKYDATSRVMQEIDFITCNSESCHDIYVKIDIICGDTIQEVDEMPLL